MKMRPKLMRTGIVLIPVVAAGILAGCTTSTDPADGGFFNGVQGLSTGAYQDRIDAREAQLSSLQAANAELSRTAAAQRAEQASLSRQIRSAEQELANARAQLSSLERRLANLDAAGQQNATVSNARSQLNSLQSQTNTIAANGVTDAERARLAQIAAETARIQAALDAAVGASVGL